MQSTRTIFPACLQKAQSPSAAVTMATKATVLAEEISEGVRASIHSIRAIFFQISSEAEGPYRRFPVGRDFFLRLFPDHHSEVFLCVPSCPLWLRVLFPITRDLFRQLHLVHAAHAVA